MNKHRSFLLLAVFILALGCYLVVAGTAIDQAELPMYLGATCLLVAVCVAALIQTVQAQRERIEVLERRLAEKQSPAEPVAAPDRGGM